uniref:GG11575 n=1 Tax=Drosophila erecta TaxID=7220 RepID=B3P5X0_DROER
MSDVVGGHWVTPKPGNPIPAPATSSPQCLLLIVANPGDNYQDDDHHDDDADAEAAQFHLH